MEHYFFSTPITATETADSPGVLSGYAMKFNILSHDRGGYRDTFRPGVFSNLSQSDGLDIKAYRDHNDDKYLARTANDTLTLSTDDIGLKFSLTLPDTQDGRDTAALIKRKDIEGMSFGYSADAYTWSRDGQTPVRQHTSGRLAEISVVFDPGFPHTELMLSSLGEPDPAVIAELNQWLGTPRRNSAYRRLRLGKFNFSNYINLTP
jgi:HK97 family phage prohead protease